MRRCALTPPHRPSRPTAPPAPQSYAWFLPTWRKYERVVERGDAIRYFIMHSVGGMYMDVDVECFRWAAARV